MPCVPCVPGKAAWAATGDTVQRALEAGDIRKIQVVEHLQQQPDLPDLPEQLRSKLNGKPKPIAKKLSREQLVELFVELEEHRARAHRRLLDEWGYAPATEGIAATATATATTEQATALTNIGDHPVGGGQHRHAKAYWAAARSSAKQLERWRPSPDELQRIAQARPSWHARERAGERDKAGIREAGGPWALLRAPSEFACFVQPSSLRRGQQRSVHVIGPWHKLVLSADLATVVTVIDHQPSKRVRGIQNWSTWLKEHRTAAAQAKAAGAKAAKAKAKAKAQHEVRQEQAKAAAAARKTKRQGGAAKALG